MASTAEVKPVFQQTVIEVLTLVVVVKTITAGDRKKIGSGNGKWKRCGFIFVFLYFRVTASSQRSGGQGIAVLTPLLYVKMHKITITRGETAVMKNVIAGRCNTRCNNSWCIAVAVGHGGSQGVRVAESDGEGNQLWWWI